MTGEGNGSAKITKIMSGLSEILDCLQRHSRDLAFDASISLCEQVAQNGGGDGALRCAHAIRNVKNMVNHGDRIAGITERAT